MTNNYFVSYFATLRDGSTQTWGWVPIAATPQDSITDGDVIKGLEKAICEKNNYQACVIINWRRFESAAPTPSYGGEPIAQIIEEEQQAAPLSDDVRQVLLDLTNSYGIIADGPDESDKNHAEHLLAKAITSARAILAAYNGGKHAD